VEVEADGRWRRIATGINGRLQAHPAGANDNRGAVRVVVLDTHGSPRINRVSLHRAE
jgi:hypothetical protein